MLKSEPPVSENKISARVLSSIIIKITKSPIIIKLSYALEKKSIIPVILGIVKVRWSIYRYYLPFFFSQIELKR